MKLFITGLLSVLAVASGRAQDQQMSSILSAYINYPSTELNEKPAGMFLLNTCREKGLYTEILTDEDTAFNFVASLYPLSLGKPNIILLNHIDVVGISDSSAWIKKPFSGIQEKDTIWGRGAIDNKGMAVAQLFALEKIKEQSGENDLPYNISMLSVSGEETGGKRGAELMIKKYLHLLNACFILGEGGSGVTEILSGNRGIPVFGISTAEKSQLILHLELELTSSGHGPVPPPEYATKEMVKALDNLLSTKGKIIFSDITENSLNVLGRHEPGLKGFIIRKNRFFLFRPLIKSGIRKNPLLASLFQNTITLTGIDLPVTAANQISTRITATLDCRLLPGADTEKFVKMVSRNLRDKRINLTIQSQQNPGGRSMLPEFYIALCRSLKESYPNAVNLEIIFPATSDNHYFRAAGIPVFGLFPAVFSPEQLQTIHNQNEYITNEQLRKSVQVYTAFLEKIISGNKAESMEKAGF